MTVTSEMAVQDLMELAKGIQVLQDDARGLWSADDLISLFEEMTSKERC